MSKRVYVVNGARLVRAYSPVTARNHVAQATITSELATQETLIKLLAEGVRVEDAGVEQKDMDDGEPTE